MLQSSMRQTLKMGKLTSRLLSTRVPKQSVKQGSLVSYVGGGLLGALVFSGAGVYYRKQNDEGFARSLHFWTNAFPAYAHYRVKQLQMEQILKLPEHEQDIEYEELHEKYAPKMFDVVLNLKGFYIKLAQIGSTRSDFLPKQYLDRATELQSDAPSKPIEEVIAVIEKSYGKPIAEIFQYIDPLPLGAASIGQAHKAVLLDGSTVVVKVQYPEAEQHFRNDMATIKSFCELAQPAHVSFLNEVEKQFMTEFDYTKEAKNLAEVRSNIQKSPFAKRFVVPKPIEELCTKHVLVMEYLKGTKLIDGIKNHFEFIANEKNTSVEELKKEQERQDNERQAKGLERATGPSEQDLRLYAWTLAMKDWVNYVKNGSYNWTLGWVFGPIQEQQSSRKKHLKLLNLPEIVRSVVEVHGYEIFIDGCFNGDPHPGNIMLLDDGRIGLIDYGQVKHITKDQRVRLAKLVVALAEGTSEDVVRCMKEDIGVVTKHSDPYVLEKFGRLMMDRDDRSVTDGLNVQLFMEKLEKMDPIVHQEDDFVMAFRVSLLLRGLSYALRYDTSHAKMWLKLAKQAIAEAE